MKSGFFLVDKEADISSAGVVSKLKKKFDIKKIGHMGTLDPFATGLLVCPINMATRLIPFFQDGNKIYSGTILLGTKTDSDDITGNILQESNVRFSKDEIENISKKFLGNIVQIPPKISAIKINGKRAYDRFRSQEEFEMKSREVQIFSFVINNIFENEIAFQIECSKGTYIRSIARDLGEALGTVACLKTLRREASKPFYVKDAKTISEIKFEDLISWQELFLEDQKIMVSADEALRLNIGDNIFLQELLKSDSYKGKIEKNNLLVYIPEDKNLKSGILVKENDSWKFAVNAI